jgi:hypothetical protein
MFCEVRPGNVSRYVLAASAALAGACGGKTRPPVRLSERPTPTVQVGACGEPEHDGVVGERPVLRHADRDLDGDGVAELVVADKGLCTAEGNCWWNVFRRSREGDGCARYAGSIAAASLEPLAARGDDGFADVRGVWNLTSPDRLLVQDYRYVRGGYQVVDALLCRREKDDRLLCTEDSR